jgi:lipopolysaccharide biosynthesis glycosyltransferase
MEEINVVFATDDAWAAYAGAAILSVCSSSPPDERFAFHVLTLGLSQENTQKFSELEKQIGRQISIYLIDSVAIGLPAAKNYVQTCYLRIFVAELLPHLDKVIYLDCDLTVIKPLRELYDIDISERAAAAASERLGIHRDLNKEYCKSLGISEPNKYFNAGVMMLNLTFWRENAVGARCVTWFEKYAEVGQYADQDALNFLLQGKVLMIPSSWNLTTWIVKAALYQRLRGEFRSDVKNAAIVHFTGDRKPWRRELRIPFASIFRDNLLRTPWGKSALPPLTPRMVRTRILEEIAHAKKVTRAWIIPRRRKRLRES